MNVSGMTQPELAKLCNALLANEHVQRWLPSFIANKSIDSDGEPVPWICYPAVDLVKERVPQGIKVFEYGSGYGTLWWATRAARVVAVEHDKEWFDYITPMFPKNVRAIHRELEYGGKYAQTVAELRTKFSIIIIDGRDRNNCAYSSVKALTHDGVIILDNSDRKAYTPGREYLHSQGFKELRLTGNGPSINGIIQTSFFYKPENCLGL